MHQILHNIQNNYQILFDLHFQAVFKLSLSLCSVLSLSIAPPPKMLTQDCEQDGVQARHRQHHWIQLSVMLLLKSYSEMKYWKQPNVNALARLLSASKRLNKEPPILDHEIVGKSNSKHSFDLLMQRSLSGCVM